MPYKWAALLIVAFGTFNTGLDMGIVAISLPKLAEVYRVGPEAVLWVSLVHPLLGAGLSLTLGRAGDIFGRERLYAFGFATFTVGLIMCAVAQNIYVLILSRIFAVVGLAMLMTNSTAIASSVFPLSERGKAIGILMGAGGAGGLMGPLLGGFLLERFSWPAIFYTRIPLAVIGTGLAFSLLKKQPSHGKPGFDLRGAFVLFAGLTSLILTFNQGWSQGWTSPMILALVGTTVVSFLIFLKVEGSARTPAVDLNLLRSRMFSLATSSAVIAFMAATATGILMPFYLMNGAGYSWDTAGTILTVSSAINILVSPLGGMLGDKFRSFRLGSLGMALSLIGLFLLRRLDSGSSMPQIIFPLLLSSLGSSLFVTANGVAMISAVPQDKLGTASAMIPTSRMVGSSVGSAIAMAVYGARKHSYVAQLTSQGITSETAGRLGTVSGFHNAILVMLGLGCLALLVTFLSEGRRS